jgi:DNA-binding CsgD family transcriptional regulator
MARRRAANEEAGNGRAAASPVHFGLESRTCFAIEGHYFIAVPADEWSSLRGNGEGDGKDQAVGFVRLDGTKYVLLEQDRAKEPTVRQRVTSLLTGRELQIAYSVAEGKGDKTIAYDLGISEYTVREHIRRIFHKLKVCKRSALVAQLVMTVSNEAEFNLPSKADQNGLSQRPAALMARGNQSGRA